MTAPRCRHVKFNTPLVELTYQAVETAKCLLEDLAARGAEEVGVASIAMVMCFSVANRPFYIMMYYGTTVGTKWNFAQNVRRGSTLPNLF